MNSATDSAAHAVHVQRSSWHAILQAVLVGLVMPNVWWAIVAWYFALHRPLVNIDYGLALLVLAFGWRIPALALLVVFFVVDALMLVVQAFPFMRTSDLLYFVSLIPRAPIYYQAFLAASVLWLLLVVFIWKRLREPRRFLLAGLFLLNLALLGYGLRVYEVEGSQTFSRQLQSQSIALAEHRVDGFIRTFAMTGEALQPIGFTGVSARWINKPASELNQRMLLVVAESWGVLQDDAAQRAVLQPLLSRRKDLAWLQTGELPVVGATVAAELRELCGLWPLHFNLSNQLEGFEDCLPNRLRKLGYATTAAHGAVSVMYDRRFWYPRAGFDHTEFRETRHWQSRCFSFPGVCDWEILQQIIQPVLARGGRQFVYWLTLNTHAYYDRRDLHGNYFDCAANGLSASGAACRLSMLHAQFFHDITRLLDDPAMQGVEVLIVGDHAPPLTDATGGDEKFKKDVVAWAHFVIGREAPGEEHE